MTAITKKAKYGLMKNSEGTTRIGIYNERPSFYPAQEELLEDVEINIENGIMDLKANVISFFHNFDDLSYETLEKTGEYVLDEKYVKSPKYFKFLPKTYTKRWVEEKQRLPMKITANTFEIVENGESNENNILDN